MLQTDEVEKSKKSKYECGHCYVFVRNDISDSQKAVQAGHAAIESQREFRSAQHPALVILKVKNERKLESVINELTEHDIDFVTFRDDIFDYELTAVATKPIYGDKRKLLRRYSLL